MMHGKGGKRTTIACARGDHDIRLFGQTAHDGFSAHHRHKSGCSVNVPQLQGFDAIQPANNGPGTKQIPQIIMGHIMFDQTHFEGAKVVLGHQVTDDLGVLIAPFVRAGIAGRRDDQRNLVLAGAEQQNLDLDWGRGVEPGSRFF